jgi:hypothetical protein
MMMGVFVSVWRGVAQAADECSAVLELDAKHTGALMLRAQTLVAMKDYHSALFDVNRLLDLNPSSEVYRSLQARLRTQLVCLHIIYILSICPHWEKKVFLEHGWFRSIMLDQSFDSLHD